METVTTPAGSGKKVLVVEDDVFFVDLLTKKLTGKGFLVSSAHNSEEVFKLMETFKPDIFLLDVLLPGMDGFDIYGKIKEKAGFEKIPVIFLSNMGSKEYLERSKQVGAANFLIKATVTLDQVVGAIHKVIG